MADISKLDSMDALDAAFAEADGHTVVIFKHSLICPTSRRAFNIFQDFVADHGGDGVAFKLIEIQRQRALSREVAERTGVKHESPQALVLRDGEVTWHDSHFEITREALTAALGASAPAA